MSPEAQRKLAMAKARARARLQARQQVSRRPPRWQDVLCPCDSLPSPHDARDAHPGEDRIRGIMRLEAIGDAVDPEGTTLADWED